MLSLTKVKLPDCINVDGKLFSIKTDFRDWLNFSRVVNTKDAVIDDVDFIYINEVPPAAYKRKAFEKMLEFFQPKSELPRKMPGASAGKVLDYELDADLIYAAFMEQYRIDLMETDEKGHAVQMHWHIFLTLLQGLHNTKLNEIMSWRGWKGNAKTPEGKLMQSLKNAWELPADNQDQINKDLQAFNALFEKK